MRKSQFLKHIESLEIEDLKEEITLLFDKVKGVKEYYKMELGSDEDRLKMYTTLKKEITKCFVTRSYRKPRRPRIKKLKALLKEAHKNSIFDHEMADVYLHASEAGLYFNMEYDFYSETLRNNIIQCFEKSLMLISSSMTKDLFEERVQKHVSHKRTSFDLRLDLIKLKEEYFN